MSSGAKRVAIIGGGYSGMAAAVELTRAGAHVDVYEAAEVLGGRARRVEAQGLALDNGLHILIGAYRETLRLLSLVSRKDDAPALHRTALELEIAGQFHLKTSPIRFPWNLAMALWRASGLSAGDKWRIVRLLAWLKAHRYTVAEDICVEQFMRQHRQTPRATRFLWFPLCTAALNTAPSEASAQIFANVLRDTFSAPSHNSDLLLPATDLSTLFPERAARFVHEHGGRVHLRTRVSSVTQCQGEIALTTRGGTRTYPYAILAVAPHHVSALIENLPDTGNWRDTLARFDYQPIYSVYLAYPPATRLPKPMLGLAGGQAQWAFDRGQLCAQPGLMGVVISASGAHQDISHPELALQVHRELQSEIPDLPAPLWHQVIAERRATFACTPRLQRPSPVCAVPGLFLAGDYLLPDYPATLESAVRSAVHAAQLVMRHS